MHSRSRNIWQYILCSDCWCRIRPDQVDNSSQAARLCSACVDDGLFNNTTPVHQRPRS
jgi:hypothetical protein